MNYYHHHIGDYAKATGHLSVSEHGVLLLLRDRYFDTEGPIEASLVYRICRAKMPHERHAVDTVLAEFFTLDGTAWRCKRFDAVLVEQGARIETARSNGARGGRKSAIKSTVEQTQREPSGQALQSPITNHQYSVPNGTGSDGASAPASPAAPVIEASAEPTGQAQPAADPPKPTAPAADSPPEPTAKDRCWALGVGLLVSAGVREPQARSMLGLWMRDHGADALHAALADCAAEQAIAPVAWLQARLGPSVRRGARPAPKHAEPHWRAEQKAKVARIMARGAVALGLGPDGLMDAPGTASVTTMETIDADHDTPRIRIAGR